MRNNQIILIASVVYVRIAAGQSCTDDRDCGSKKTNETKVSPYKEHFDWFLSHHILMNDYIRMETYFQTILTNVADFKDKVVMDLGAGTGILSTFAAQAGAKKVYAVEPAAIARHTQANGWGDVITVINQRIEDVSETEIENVDVIVSDPFGSMGLHGRTVEKLILARDRFLKPDGKMYPSVLSLYMAPFTDQKLANPPNEWNTPEKTNFHGVNLTVLQNFATADNFKHMNTESVKPDILMAKPHKHMIKLKEIELTELLDFEVQFSFDILRNGVMHGLMFWFDVGFIDGSSPSWFSTAPGQIDTHYKQARFVFRNGRKIAIDARQICAGIVHFQAAENDAYDVAITMENCPATDVATDLIVSRHSTEANHIRDGDLLHYLQLLSTHLNDMQLYAVYRQAMLLNPTDVAGKTVLVVDATVCVLPVIAAQLGAAKVYAQETVFTAACQAVVEANNFGATIEVFSGKLEEKLSPNEVDLIISNRFSYLFFHNRKHEHFLAAKKFLKPNGKMFPSEVTLFAAPFAETLIIHELQSSGYLGLWERKLFYGNDMTSFKQPALDDLYNSVIIDKVQPRVLISAAESTTFSLRNSSVEDFKAISMPVTFKALRTALVDGLVLWFQLRFPGSTQKVDLSTGPSDQNTNFGQTRILFKKPVFVRAGRRLNGTVTLNANTKGTYDLQIEMTSETETVSGTYDLRKKMGRNPKPPLPGPLVGYVQSSPTDTAFSNWRPGASVSAGGQQSNKVLNPDMMPLSQFLYNRLYYYYKRAKVILIGRVSMSSLF